MMTSRYSASLSCRLLHWQACERVPDTRLQSQPTLGQDVAHTARREVRCTVPLPCEVSECLSLRVGGCVPGGRAAGFGQPLLSGGSDVVPHLEKESRTYPQELGRTPKE